MRCVAIVQARMTSSRLPGKVLADLHGAPMLQRQLERMQGAKMVDAIGIATTTNADDDAVVALADALGLPSHRGSEHDVLSRFVEAAARWDAQVIVRITADCPLIDATEIDRVIDALRNARVDYASNVAERTFPRGLDCEVLTMDALRRCDALGRSALAREHVTTFIHTEQPALFSQTNVSSRQAPAADLRWTVDTAEDLEMARAVYRGLDLARTRHAYPEILAWVRAHPEVSKLNASVPQKTT